MSLRLAASLKLLIGSPLFLLPMSIYCICSLQLQEVAYLVLLNPQLLPIVLVIVFYELSPNRPNKNAIKWGLTFMPHIFLQHGYPIWVIGYMEHQRKDLNMLSLILLMLYFFHNNCGIVVGSLQCVFCKKNQHLLKVSKNLTLKKIGAILIFFWIVHGCGLHALGYLWQRRRMGLMVRMDVGS